MVTIDEIKAIGQWSAREHMVEEAKTYPYAGRVLRKVSPYLTKFLLEHGFTANQMSFGSIVLGITGNLMFTFGDYYFMLVGCFLYQFWNILDLVDGEIARTTNVKTLGGKYLETINEVITECGFVACLGIGLSNILNNETFTILGLVFGLFICLLNYFARTRDAAKEQLGRRYQRQGAAETTSPIKKLYKRLRLFFVIINGYIVSTFIVLFELLLPIELRYDAFGLSYTVLSTYFLLYGTVWIARAAVSSITNYRYLMKAD